MKKIILKRLLLFGEIIFGLILVLVIVVSIFPLVPPFRNYYHSRTVLTGSMEPKIPKGSVVINQWADQKNLKVGDVITYQRTSDKKNIYITHRIVKIDKTGLLWRFETKGDVNPASDFGLVTQAGIEGKMIFMIPLIGYLIEFFKTPLGFILLIALPLLVFIVRQARDVLEMWKKRNVPPAPPDLTKKKTRKVLALIFIAFAFLAARVSFVTYASFTSGQATITGVTLSTASSFGSGPQPGDVVINEVMWMGSTASTADGWIELRNTTGTPINLTGWKIDGAGSGSSSISLSGTIPANGFFLLSNNVTNASAVSDSINADQVTTSLSLLNTGEQLTLRDSASTVIDQTPSGSWPAGENGTDKKSMERNDTPGDGTSSGSWHTCTDSACNSTIYWDSEGNNYGTPKAANLSEDNPASPSPLPSPSPTPEPSTISSLSPTAESESSPSPSSTPCPEVSPTPTPSPTPEISPTPTPTVEPSPTPSPSPEPSPEISLTPALTPTPGPTSEQ